MAENLVIIGSGPAGYTAAIYAARAELKPVVIEGTNWGGQLMITTDVDNYPGFAEGIQGPELMKAFRAQAERFGAQLVTADAEEVNFKKGPFTIRAGEKTYEARTVIVATGARARLLGLTAEKKLMGRGVSACATCDGFFFKGQEVAVVGGGDTALEEALFLSRFATKITVIHRRDKLRASPAMQKRARAEPKIEFLWDSIVEDIEDVKAGKVTGLRVKNVQTGKVSDFKCEGFFVAIGHEPNTGIFEGQLKMNEAGYLKVEAGTTQTNVAGVFAAGDVADPTYRQAVTAAGSGCQAALDAQRYLETLV